MLSRTHFGVEPEDLVIILERHLPIRVLLYSNRQTTFPKLLHLPS